MILKHAPGCVGPKRPKRCSFASQKLPSSGCHVLFLDAVCVSFGYTSNHFMWMWCWFHTVVAHMSHETRVMTHMRPHAMVQAMAHRSCCKSVSCDPHGPARPLPWPNPQPGSHGAHRIPKGPPRSTQVPQGPARTPSDAPNPPRFEVGPNCKLATGSGVLSRGAIFGAVLSHQRCNLLRSSRSTA